MPILLHSTVTMMEVLGPKEGFTYMKHMPSISSEPHTATDYKCNDTLSIMNAVKL